MRGDMLFRKQAFTFTIFIGKEKAWIRRKVKQYDVALMLFESNFSALILNPANKKQCSIFVCSIVISQKQFWVGKERKFDYLLLVLCRQLLSV